MSEQNSYNEMSLEEIEKTLTFSDDYQINTGANDVILTPPGIEDNSNEDKDKDKNKSEPEPEPNSVNEPAEPEKIEIQTTTPELTIYSQLAKERLSSGEWEDVLVGETGKEVPLSELIESGNFDEEIYNRLKEDFNEHKEKELQSKYIKVDDLSDKQKSLINLVKLGDYEKAKEFFINHEQVLKEPFPDYSSDNEQYNIQILKWFYTKVENKTDKEANALISVLQEDATLDVKAEEIVNQTRNHFHERLRQAEVAAEEEKKQEQARIKQYKKDLVSELKTAVDENLAKRFSETATKYDKEGNLEIDNIYDQWMRDPKKASKLIHFLLDEENFLKKATQEVKKNTLKDTLRTVNIIRQTSKTPTTPQEEENKFNIVFD
jgi:hypothetical protein